MSKKVLIISSSPRKGGNSDLLCDGFEKGALEAGNEVEKIFLKDKTVHPCTGCSVCSMYGKPCPQKDDAAEIVEKIAKVLNVREETFYMPNDTIVDLIRTLIWYDWEHSLPFQDFGDSTQCFLLRIRLSCSHPAVKALLADWQIHRTAFENGRITSSDYLEWMLQWPPTLSAPDD